MKKILCFLLSFPVTGFSQSANNEIIDSLETKLKTSKEDTLKVLTLDELSWTCVSVSTEKALKYGFAGLSLAQKLRYKRGIARIFSDIAAIHNSTGSFDSAITYYEKLRVLQQESNNKVGVATALAGLANAYNRKDNLAKAIQLYFDALKLDEEANYKRGIATCFSNLGIIFDKQKRYDKAIGFYEKAYAINDSLKDAGGMIRCLNNISNSYYQMNDFEKAIAVARQALHLNEKLNNLRSRSMTLTTLGLIYSDKKEYASAVKYYKEALNTVEQLGDKTTLATIYINTGDLLRKQGQVQSALEYLNKGYKLSLETGSKQEIRECARAISDSYEQTGDFKKALFFNKIYSAYSDSVFDEESSRQITEINTRYETEKKDKELSQKDAAIAKQNAELTEKEARAKRLRLIFISSFLALLIIATAVFFFIRQQRINEKLHMQKQLSELEHQALRLQMNPHFIFNSLSSISNFIGRNETDEAKKFLAKFARLMRLILENSREQFVPLQKEMDSLRHYLELEQLRFDNKFSFTVTSEKIAPEHIHIPPMLIQPHAENAIVHGIGHKKGSGKITIRFHREADRIICTIEDDGVGRQQAKELKEKTGIAHQSLALKVTAERLKIFNSASSLRMEDLVDDRNDPAGTRISFGMPFQDLSLA